MSYFFLFLAASIYLERWWWYRAYSEGHSNLSAPASSHLIGLSSVALAKRSYSLLFLQNVFRRRARAMEFLLCIDWSGNWSNLVLAKLISLCLQRQLTQQCIKIRLDLHIKKRAKVGSRGSAKDHRCPCMCYLFANYDVGVCVHPAMYFSVCLNS